ncbi:hypothetical protein [uncultured Friedmanniella sp.]|uniref:hypothetical protein n=1 Tax=uncultured Friedmanniella sp. TaxID=335381 RepID=UPI0035CABDA1
MTDNQAPQPEQGAPGAQSATEPEKTPTHWRTRRWLAGATLVTVGLAAGGGVTYAFTATNNDGAGNGTSAVSYGEPT